MKKLKYLLMACCAACVWLAACSDDDYEPLPDWWWEQTGEPAVYPEPEPVDNKVVAHRGCYAETGFPQNSVAGLKKAGLAVAEVKEKRGWECIVCKKA